MAKDVRGVGELLRQGDRRFDLTFLGAVDPAASLSTPISWPLAAIPIFPPEPRTLFD
jgi:hypothetical protein